MFLLQGSSRSPIGPQLPPRFHSPSTTSYISPDPLNPLTLRLEKQTSQTRPIFPIIAILRCHGTCKDFELPAIYISCLNRCLYLEICFVCSY